MERARGSRSLEVGREADWMVFQGLHSGGVKNGSEIAQLDMGGPARNSSGQEMARPEFIGHGWRGKDRFKSSSGCWIYRSVRGKGGKMMLGETLQFPRGLQDAKPTLISHSFNM